ncbi:MAG: TetR/AcrR family transcriptional regulator, partial [Alphaproteobacteria bacterium]|nr:TetR/AcrR family transcriptional regulator [Alphaproteobacteria bacterium]
MIDRSLRAGTGTKGAAKVDATSEKSGNVAKKKRLRDAEATKLRILEAAKSDFAKNGLGGARVDVIAAKAKANKRMIYHYFGSKDNLFQTVIENAYLDIRTAEQTLNLDDLKPKDALERLVR